MIRIGVDLGGTKIEALALDQHGQELERKNWRERNRWNRHPGNSFSENRVGEKCQFHLVEWEALQP